MTILTLKHEKESYDPLGLALLFAVAIHVFIILGISFIPHEQTTVAPDKILDITLNKVAKPEKTNKDAEFLGISNQLGGAIKKGYSAPQIKPQVSAKKPSKSKTSTPKKSGTLVHRKKQKKVITSKSKVKIASIPKEKKVSTPIENINIANLLEDTQLEIDQLIAELDQRNKVAAMQKRRKQISASTQEYKYAAYMNAWRKKVENIGNLNYPDEAKSKKLYGSLLLHVSINSDGSIQHIRVARSSGHKVLDDAAIRIVRLAAPYAPFPPAIKKEVDILDITRTWQFRNGNQLFAN